MDIPNTGAIFTLGKSYLAENTQSYFYIRNDPIKRLIAGPQQSAVICESGRLFVWGENNHGQLGIGNHSNHNNNENEKDSKTNHSDIITKPTCVKSLKALGLKIADIAFGNDWSIILTHSNEIFFSGRNIFPSGSNVSHNFTTTTVADEQCEIIRKPFRIDELDNCLTKNENAEEYYTTVLSGNDHFILMTSLGRLIAWGSNENYQLGMSNDEIVQKPYEINLDAPVQQFVCGPESTLVLTTNGKLYLTGVLNEFVFTQFTELQKNLSPTEQIIFMHISKTNEIYIVTNAGSIYRSIESLRTKTLVFQRFYDYDSEENGPIWKLLKGFSFYTVLTKANKFYTTFSESGHHLKTFREISKFKNLRLLDVAVGNQHILVHGIPRSSTISANVGSGTEPHRFASRTFIMPANIMNGSADRNRSRGPSATKVENKANETGETVQKKFADINSNVLTDDVREITPTLEGEKFEMKLNGENIKEDTVDTLDVIKEKFIRENVSASAKDDTVPSPTAQLLNENKKITISDSKNETKHEMAATAALVHNEAKSPTESETSRKSVKISPQAVNNETSPTLDKHLRPQTPYPDSSTTASTPTTIKKTPLRNYSYEAAMDHDHIDRTSPELIDSLENIPEDGVNALATLPFEEDEHLAVEINTTTDPLNSTIVVNEIRFINNGVDVTDNVKAESFDIEDTESIADSSEEHVDDTDINSGEALNHFHKEVEGKNVDAGNMFLAKVESIEGHASQMSSAIKKEAKKIDSEAEHFAQTQIKNGSESVSRINNELSTKAKHITEDANLMQSDLKAHAEEASKTLTDKIENLDKKAVTTATNFRDSVETEIRDGVSEQSEHISDTVSEIKDSLSTKAKSIEKGVKRIETNLKSETEKANDTLNKNIENAVKNTTIAATELHDSMETEIKDGFAAKAEQISEAATEIKDNLSTKAKDLSENVSQVKDDLSTKAVDISESVSKGVTKTQTDLKSQTEKVATTLTENLENAAKKAANAATDVRDSVETAAKRTAAGARDVVEKVGENAKQVTNDTKNTVESLGSSARKIATGAKNAVGNVFIKMSDGTKDAVDTVAAKIVNEVQDAKENINTMFHGKSLKPPQTEDDAVSLASEAASKEGGPKTNTTIGEDDERTTASVNSTQNSTGNPFDGNNPFESPNPYDNEFDDVVERGKKALQDEINNLHQQEPQISEEPEKEKGKLRQFFSDIRAISCRNEKSVAVQDEPPRYSVEDKYPTQIHSGDQQNNTSKVCSIL